MWFTLPIENEFKIDTLNEKIKQSFMHVENSFKEILNEIEKTLEDIAYESEKIVGSGETFVDQFGTKVISLVSEVKKPDKINFQNIEAYISTLNLFQRKIIYYGARWLRKTGPAHKFSIRQIEQKRKRLLNLSKDLETLFSKHQIELIKWKRAENTLRKLSKLEEERSVNRMALGSVESKLKELKIRIAKDEKEIQSLTRKEDLVEARKLENSKALFEETVRKDLKHLEKPVLKAIKLIEDRSIEIDQPKIIELEKFISNSKSALLDLNRIKPIEDALIYLQKLLKSKKLNLKSSRTKKGIETISSILKEDKIKEYEKTFNEYAKQSRRLEVEGTIGRTRELEEIQEEYRKNKETLGHVIIEKKRIEEDAASCEGKIKEYLTKLEELI